MKLKSRPFLLIYPLHLSIFGRELRNLLAVLNLVRAQDKGPLRATDGRVRAVVSVIHLQAVFLK